MAGINAQTGKSMDDLDHVRQSIRDILTTPLGSRVLRRDYGSRLFELIDSGLNNGGIASIYQAVVTALAIWEPRFSVQNVQVVPSVGGISLSLTGVYKPNGQTLKLSGIDVSGGRQT
ncbi:GPW/gp25 family protein [Bombella pollinis]|uniref:GPW/gp25 family protein n=1 Tax=Bombella pollinis TaxID=2967337 RepID=A0ABT3WS42_9PROT|nr:GPW/gp25 family protein [Bombella pollinis]MCX5620503.1 GPW/gp25 family protein [Bombella pollinis]